MSTLTKQELMAKYHHLRDHLSDLDRERGAVQKELEVLIAALLPACLNKNNPN